MNTGKTMHAAALAKWPGITLVAALVAGCFGVAPAWANPGGAQVANGQASFTNNGNVLTIANSPGAIINWQNFSVGAGEITRFLQQNASSSVLNRVVGQDPSQILGALQSNGKVFLINPNGILFGAGAQVNVNGLVASSLNLSNENFLAGKMRFDAGAGIIPGKVSNQGSITTPSGGQVYLIAPQVENSGIVTSPQGDVILAAGRSVQLVDSSSPDVHVVVNSPTDQAINLGQVIAQGGKIGIYGALVNQRGLLNANSAVVGENGKIMLKASGDTLLEAGSVTTATGAGTGGMVQILGDRVGLTADAIVDASGQQGGGTVLVGGDYHGSNAAVQNASRTYVGSATQIKADALSSGDGGKVIVWSDDITRAYGSISARGGPQGGNGGFVEASGKKNLDFHAKVDVTAKAGNNGTLLLDPASITITGGSGDGDIDGNTTFAGNAVAGTANFADEAPSFIYQSELEGMAAGTNIVLEATDFIGASGTFNNLVTLANNSNLTLRTRNASSDGAGPIGINLIGSTDSTNLTFKTQGTGTITMQTGTGASPQAASIMLGKLVTGGGAVSIAGTGNVTVGDITTTPNAGMGGDVTIASSAGAITINRNIDARGASDVSGNVTLNAAGAIAVHNSAQENMPIYANQLTMMASGGISDSGGPAITKVSTLTATNSGSGAINISNIGDLQLSGSGVVQNGGGDIVLSTTAGGNINVASAINAGTGSVTLRGAAINELNGAVVTGASLDANATSGIGQGTALITRVGALTANNSGANTDIKIANTGALTLNDVQQSALGSTGNISIDNIGALTTANGATVSTQAGSITLVAHSPLTINGTVQSAGGGAINLTAGANGSTADKLTLANTGALNTTGAITLKAGDAIILNGTVSGGSITRQSNTNVPTLVQCVASPSLAGCASVLPTLGQCAVTPTLPGCSAVLPTLAQCSTHPTLTGCTVVLPTLAQCAASPTLAGCTVVLPTLAQCAANPTLAGCSVVLPTLPQCAANPTLAGCTAILPTLTQCSATPSLAGCSVVLPSLAQCVASPTLAGCSVVLPPISQCIANPGAPGCASVAPLQIAATKPPASVVDAPVLLVSTPSPVFAATTPPIGSANSQVPTLLAQTTGGEPGTFGGTPPATTSAPGTTASATGKSDTAKTGDPASPGNAAKKMYCN